MTQRQSVIIDEMQETELECTGYKPNLTKKVVVCFLAVLSCGFLLLVFYWKKDWRLKCMYSPCHLSEAEAVLLKDIYMRKHVAYIQITSNVDSDELSGLLKRRMPDSLRFFKFQKLKYIWDAEGNIFFRLRALDNSLGLSSADVFDCGKGLTTSDIRTREIVYGENVIHVHVRPYFVLLVQEALNPFYVFQVFSVTIWMIDEYYYYSVCILIMSFVSIVISLYTTRKQAETLRDMVFSCNTVTVIRQPNGIQDVPENEIVPGDVIIIPSHGCQMTCDAALIQGNCIVNESMLTGESVPVTKIPLPNISTDRDSDTLSITEHSRHILFCGTQVMQTRYYRDDHVKAVVIETGFSTAKGMLVRSILYRDAIRYILTLASVALIGFLYTITQLVMAGFPAGRIVIRSLDIITIAVPPALPAALTIGMVYAQLRLKKKSIYCISPQRINFGGILDIVCFDKTGTLTEDGLDLMGVQMSKNSTFEKLQTNMDKFPNGLFKHCMATCHSLTTIESRLLGDPIDLKMFEATDWILKEGTKVESANVDQIVPTVAKSNNSDDEIGILRQFPFSSRLQRMSVITRKLGSDRMVAYVKGSPEMITSLCELETVPEDFPEVLSEYTKNGFRVLALACKALEPSLKWHKAMQISRDVVESQLTFLGLLVMQNKLKPETEPVISELLRANIKSVMITGDNILTAINVAKKCNLVTADEQIFQVHADIPCDNAKKIWLTLENEVEAVEQIKCQTTKVNIEGDTNIDVCYAIDGKSFRVLKEHYPLAFEKVIIGAKVFARMSPIQKDQCVEKMQQIGLTVGMCGDGANDCGALKTAHVGISLSEAESSVASPFTSKTPDISCVPAIIKEGRSALTTSFGMFKYMALYSMIQFVTALMLNTFGTYLGDIHFLYIDLILNTSVVIFMGRNKSFERISVRKPIKHLMSAPIIFSFISQTAVQAIFQTTCYFILIVQPWFVPLVPDTSSKNILCFETTTIVIYSFFQYSLMAFIFTPGKPFRTPMYKNKPYTISFIVLTLFNLMVLFYPPEPIQTFFEFVELPSPNKVFQLQMLALILINIITSFFIEYCVVRNKRVMDVVACRSCRNKKKTRRSDEYILTEILSDDTGIS